MIILDNILWHDCLSSTNTYAREHIQDLDNMSVVAALAQTGAEVRVSIHESLSPAGIF